MYEYRRLSHVLQSLLFNCIMALQNKSHFKLHAIMHNAFPFSGKLEHIENICLTPISVLLSYTVESGSSAGRPSSRQATNVNYKFIQTNNKTYIYMRSHCHIRHQKRRTANHNNTHLPYKTTCMCLCWVVHAAHASQSYKSHLNADDTHAFCVHKPKKQPCDHARSDNARSRQRRYMLASPPPPRH